MAALTCASRPANRSDHAVSTRGLRESSDDPPSERLRARIAGQGLADAINRAFPNSRVDTWRALAGSAHVRSFAAGQAIVRQGDETSIALVLDGHVAVRHTTVDGRQLVMRIVTKGGLAGILPLARRPATGDALALTLGAAALWQGEEVRSLASTDPGLAVDILDHVLATLEGMTWRVDSLLHQASVRRVARILLVHADLFFGERPVLTRAILPELVGTSREMTGRVLRILESRRLVTRVGRDRLQLLDASGLEHLADFGSDRSRTALRVTAGPRPSVLPAGD